MGRPGAPKPAFLLLPLVASAFLCLLGVSSFTPDDLAAVDSLQEAESMVYARQFYEAERLLRKILPRGEEAFGARSLRYAQMLDLLAMCLYQTGQSQTDEAYELANRAVRIKREAVDADEGETARSLSILGTLHAMGGRLDAADSIFTQVLRIREANLPPDHRNIATSLNALANVRYLRSEYAAALPLARRGLAFFEAHGGAESPPAITSRANLVSILIALGDYTEALELLDVQISLLQSKETVSSELARAFSLRARIYIELGDHEAGVRERRRVLETYQEVHAAGHHRIAEAMENLGDQLMRVGEWEEARRVTEEGRALWVKSRGADHPFLASFDQVLGAVALRQGRLKDARRYWERALGLQRVSLGDSVPAVAEALTGLASVCVEEGRFEEAQRYLARSIGIISSTIGEEHPRVAAYGKELATTYFLGGDRERARREALQATTVFTRHLRRTLRSLPERQALRYAREHRAARDLYLSLVDDEQSEEAWDELIRSRALVFDEMAARHHPHHGHADAPTAALWDAYQQASTRLANLYVRGPGESEPETYRRLLADELDALEEAERRLAGAGEALGARVVRAGYREVKEALPPGAALVAYVHHGQYEMDPAPTRSPIPHYRAFILSGRDREPISFDLGPAENIDRQIANWKQEASLGALRADRTPEASLRAYASAASALRASIWDPVAECLGDTRQVFVVPDGQIHLVNLATLPWGSDGYLIESNIRFCNLTAERELLSDTPAEMVWAGALVLGAPDFDVAGRDPAVMALRGQMPDCGDLRSLRFDPLPGALEEARAVAHLWQMRSGDAPVTLLAGTEASEAAFKQLAPGHALLHLATHGYFIGGECTTALAGGRGIGRLIEGRKDTISAVPSETLRRWNPLLLSGLALAGANRRGDAAPAEEDGILTAQEIACLDLSGARWAVLSACDTGTGEVLTGEGVFGLQRAFRVAGARTVVTSLWSVRDETTRQWMEAFYRAGVAEDMTAVDAVGAASRELLREGRQQGETEHPFYWGAFVSTGDWRR